MQQMPTAVLPADSFYEYQPDSDTWIVQKKTVNKKLSKRDNPFESAICPSCGEWKPTDFTPEELKEKEWECMDCMNKRLTDPQSLPENRGQKPITKFDPEFEWLLKLVNVIAKAAPEAMSEIKTLSKSHPFKTIDDAGDLAAQIWTLVTEKYGIPREWLMKKLPERKASLNKKAETIEVHTYGGKHLFPVTINPTYNETLGLLNKAEHGSLRYMLDEDNNLAVWDSYYATHDQVAGELREAGYNVAHEILNGFIQDKKDIRSLLGSLNKKAYEGGYPTENDATTWGTAAPGTYAYQPNINHDAPTGLREGDTGEPIVICPTCKSDKIDKESSPAKCQVCGTDFVPKPDRGSDDPTVNDYSQNYFWGPNDLGRSHQHSPADNSWAPAGTEDYDGVSSNVMMSSFKSFMHKQSNLNKVAHCGPCSVLKMEALHILIDLYYKDNNLFPEEVIEELSVVATELKLDNFNDILESVIEEYLEEKTEEVGDKLPKLKNLLIALKDIAPKLGKEIEVVDKQDSKKEVKADLKDYSNQLTRDVNDYIVSHGNVLHEVILETKLASSEAELSNWLQRALSGVVESLIYDPTRHYEDETIYWNELAYAYYASVKGGEDEQRRFQKKEPLVNVDIQNLPTLDKSKKLDELLDQLSTETDPQKQEQIKQHIERIKNASLKQATKEVPTLSNKVITDLIPMFVDKTDPPDHKCKTCSFRIEKGDKATCAIMKGEINLEKGSCSYWTEREVPQNTTSSKMERTTAGYVEVDGLINCSTCKHYKHDFCNLWNGKVKDGQCCMAWEGTTIKEGSLDKQALEVVPRNPKPLIELEVKFNEQELPYIDEIASQMKEALKKAHSSDLPFDIESVYKPVSMQGGRLWIDVYASSVEEAVDKINSFFQTAFGQRKQLSSLQNISLNKQANPPSRFWIAPDGKEYRVHSAGHGAWIKLNKEVLKQYGINVDGSLDSIGRQMYEHGWSRISNEPAGTGFQIQVNNVKSLPPYLDDLIAKYFAPNNEVLIEDKVQFARIENPFPNIQKAVNKNLQQIATWASQKQASVLDEVLDQTTQDAIAAEYGPQMLVALRFYNDAVRYGQSPDRAVAYALEESKRMKRPIDQRKFMEVLNTYFQ